MDSNFSMCYCVLYDQICRFLKVDERINIDDSSNIYRELVVLIMGHRVEEICKLYFSSFFFCAPNPSNRPEPSHIYS